MTNAPKDFVLLIESCQLSAFCKRRYSRDVALRHDYRLYEFTILIRKAA